jgi:uncharacterized protein
MIKETGLSADILTTLKREFQKYPAIDQVKLYGSRAKGDFNQRSDIDLAVYGKDTDRFLIANLLLDFDDSDIPWKVDLQSYNDIKNRRLIEHIDRVGIVIYRKARTRNGKKEHMKK